MFTAKISYTKDYKDAMKSYNSTDECFDRTEIISVKSITKAKLGNVILVGLDDYFVEVPINTPNNLDDKEFIDEIIIENANGKTTEIIRSKNACFGDE